ncbi:MAG: hypothetical protein ACRECE_09320, partial [Xanthobacteraceae bacterium]
AHNLASEPAGDDADNDNDQETVTVQGKSFLRLLAALGESEIPLRARMLTWLACAAQHVRIRTAKPEPVLRKDHAIHARQRRSRTIFI